MSAYNRTAVALLVAATVAAPSALRAQAKAPARDPLGLEAAQTAQQDKDDTLSIGRWYPDAESGLNITQSAYSDNWSGGDRGSVVWAAIFNGRLQRRFNDKLAWSNAVRLAYGQTIQQNKNAAGTLVWQSPTKSTDRIDAESILRFTLGDWVSPYLSARLESQFVDASDSAGRTLNFQPVILKESAGIARQFYNQEDRSLLVRLGFTFRQNRRRVFVNPAPDLATTARTGLDAGAELITDFNTAVLNDKVAWTAKLSFYKPFFYSGNRAFDRLGAAGLAAAGVDPAVRSYTTATDIDWENVFSTQITKILSVNMYVRWRYDKYDNSVKPALTPAGTLTDPEGVQAAIRKAGQFKQTLALGLTYRFF